MKTFTLKGMKALFLAILMAPCVFNAAAEAEKAGAVSETMGLILKHHLVGKHDLNVKDLPVAKDFKEPAADGNNEIYQVPYPDGHADYFSYSVILDKKQQQYWIIRSGGFAGRIEAFGPIAVSSLEKK